MKNLFVVLVVTFASSVAFAQYIVGSKHDLSNAQAGTNAVYTTNTDGRVCVFCHVPHNANPAVNGLWNRGTGGVAFTWGAASPTVAGTTLPANADNQSVRCFTCHDGTTQIGVLFNGVTYAMAGADVTAGALGNATYTLTPTAMAGNHPVSVMYPGGNVGTDQTYNGTQSGTLVDLATYKAVAAVANARLYMDADGDYGVECGSCHDPHGTANTFFLRDTLVASALCMDCHTK